METAGPMEIALRFPQALGKPADGFPTATHNPDGYGLVKKDRGQSRLQTKPDTSQCCDDALNLAFGIPGRSGG